MVFKYNCIFFSIFSSFKSIIIHENHSVFLVGGLVGCFLIFLEVFFRKTDNLFCLILLIRKREKSTKLMILCSEWFIVAYSCKSNCHILLFHFCPKIVVYPSTVSWHGYKERGLDVKTLPSEIVYEHF